MAPRPKRGVQIRTITIPQKTNATFSEAPSQLTSIPAVVAYESIGGHGLPLLSDVYLFF